MPGNMADAQAWCHTGEGGCPNEEVFVQHAGFISVTLVLTRPLPVDYTGCSCWAPVCLWPKTHQEPMAEAVVGDVNHSCGSWSSQELRMPNNPVVAAMEETSSWEISALLPALSH